MNYSSSTFVDLGRRFVKVSEEARENIALESYSDGSRWFRKHLSLDWTELLKERLTVLLGEPGSGKTWELQHQAILHQEQGEFGFFIRLDEMISSTTLPLTDADSEMFQRWKLSKDTGYFFLDSVDEAKFKKSSDFYRALDRFCDQLGRTRLSRTVVVISSRITDWLPKTDAAAVSDRFSIDHPDTGRKESADLKVVHILPLDDEAVQKYTIFRQGEAAGPFLEALASSHALEFTRRPADIEDLFSYWVANEKLGTLTEILDFSINQQLSKASERDRVEPLTLNRAREGSQLLATATVLCQRFTFSVPGETQPYNDALNPHQCLSDDWRPDEVRALLNRSIFDGASHSRIRFHHRRLSEFLAAAWLRSLMAKGCPTRKLEKIFTSTLNSRKIFKRSTAPLAAWMCTGNESWSVQLFAWIVESSPELLLRYGDPDQLTAQQRKKLLESLQARSKTYNRRWWDEDHLTIARLANSDIEPYILEILETDDAEDTFIELAIEIAGAGKMKGCARAIGKLAIRCLDRASYFSTAVLALTQIDDTSVAASIAAKVKALESIPSRIFGPIVTLVFPRIWTVPDFLECLKKVPPSRSSYGWEYVIREHIRKTAQDSDTGQQILNGLMELLPKTHKDDEDEIELDWEEAPPQSLRKLALNVCVGMLKRKALREDEERSIAKALIWSGNQLCHNFFSRDEEQWNDLIGNHSTIRRHYFEEAYSTLRARKNESNPSLSTVTIYYDAVSLREDDINWILQRVNNFLTKEERVSAFNWSFHLWHRFEKSKYIKKQITDFGRLHSDINSVQREFFHSHFISGYRRFWHQKIRPFFFRWKWIQRKQRVENKLREIRRRIWLYFHCETLRQGKHIYALYQLLSEASTDRHRWTVLDWTNFEKKHGRRLALAARSGCKEVWRSFNPILPHEGNSNTDSIATVVALSGVAAEWQDGEFHISNLPNRDLEKAVKLATSEMNDFPPWLQEILLNCPDVIRKVLTPCLEFELAHETIEIPSRMVQRISWSELKIGSMVQANFLRFIENGTVKSPETLSHILRILSSAASNNLLSDCCSRRISTISSGDIAFPILMSFLLLVDAPEALRILSVILTPGDESENLMVQICARLKSGRYREFPHIENPSWLSYDAAKEFIPLIYRYVHPSKDILRHDGPIYTPTSRDDAQDFRASVLERLAAAAENGTTELLEAFRTNPDFKDLDSYLGNLIEKTRVIRAEGSPWSAQDIPEFSREYNLPIHTDKDLFQTACSEIEELKRLVEDGEDSPRKEVRLSSKEIGLRQWLSRRLNDRSKNRFTVVQEWEIDKRLRPDLRFVRPGVHPISLEVKIGENWTGDQLLNGISTQLVGKYLRDHRANYGIYVVGYFTSSIRWKISGKGMVDATQMATLLEEHAQSLAQNLPEVHGLSVCLINFSDN